MPKILRIKRPIKKTKTIADITFDVPIKPNIEKKLKREFTIKTRKNTFNVLILRKNGSAILIHVPNNVKSFSVEGNTYFNVKSGSYLLTRKSLINVYLEGAVLPIEHKYITYQKHVDLLLNKNGLPVKEINEDVSKIEVMDLPKDIKGQFIKTKEGYIIKRILDKIKGLEFDSVIANAIFSSGLIEKVSKPPKPDKLIFMILLLLIINTVLCIGAIAVNFI